MSFLSTDWSEQNLFVVPAEGGEPLALVHGEGFVGGSSWDAVEAFGSWSEDSRRLAFNVRGEVRVAAIPDGRVTRLDRASPDSEVRFSPSGDSVAFVRDGDLIDCQRDRAQYTPGDTGRTDRLFDRVVAGRSNGGGLRRGRRPAIERVPLVSWSALEN